MNLTQLSLRRHLALSALFTCVASTSAVFAQAPTIHDYADAAACQIGGREANYLPFGIVPGGERIPIKWNEMEVVWVPANNPPDGTGSFQIKTATGNQPIQMDFPEKGAGAKGPFNDPRQSSPRNPTGSNILCDHFPYVTPSCTPDQYIQEVLQGSCVAGTNKGAICSADAQCPASTCGGMVRWHILFRRDAAAAKVIDTNPATVQPADWISGIYTSYYDVVDAIGLKIGTSVTKQDGSYGTVWLDGLGTDACKDGPNKGKACTRDADCPTSTCNIVTGKTAARDFQNGFRAGPLPRPGGKRPDLRAEGVRASKWFDVPATMKAGNCNGCHGTPFNGSDWLAQTPLSFKNDEAKPWWHAGNNLVNFKEKVFFDSATSNASTFRCNGCHQRWMVGAGSTPGGEAFGDGMAMSRYMSMVHDAHTATGKNDTQGVLDIDNPFRALPAGSGAADDYRTLASLFRTSRPDPDLTKDMPYLDKLAMQTHVMPDPHNFATVRDWNGSCKAGVNGGKSCNADADCPLSTCNGVRLSYGWVACCGSARLGVGNTILVQPGQPANTDDIPGLACAAVTCDNPVAQSQVKPLFVTPWMQANAMNPVAPAMTMPNGNQFIDSPDSPIGVSLTVVDCPAAIPAPNPGDRCFHLTWSDPSGSPFNAPQSFRYKSLPNKLISDPDWTNIDKQATQYCGDGIPSELAVAASNVFPSTTQTQIPVASGDKWRFSYDTFGPLPKCGQMAIRLCGGWCGQAIKLAGEPDPDPAMPNRMSTDLGQLLTVANDTQGDVSNQVTIMRAGFRKNLTTGNYLQSVTLTNNGNTALPGPLSLILNGLSANATLYNASGTVGNPAAPYLSIAVGGDTLQLAPNASVSVTLEFSNPTNKGITYTTQVTALSVSAACK